MALPAIGAAAAGLNFSDITGAIKGVTDLFVDQKGSSSGTQTTSIDKVGMEYLLNQLLGSNQGLAATLNGGMGAGVYNSATQGLLANDLVARMLGEVAARNVTVTNEANTKNDAPLDNILGGTIGKLDNITGGFGKDILTGGVSTLIDLHKDPVGTVKKTAKKIGKKIKKIF